MRQFNFKYIGSEAKRNFEESTKHTRGSANYLYGKGYNEEVVGIPELLDYIKLGKGDVFYCIERLGHYHHANASMMLLEQSDVEAFKYHAYVAAKLYILSRDVQSWGIRGYTICFLFCPIMSDSPVILDFLKHHQNTIIVDGIEMQYKKRDSHLFFNKNIFLALSGEWDVLKSRVQAFLGLETSKMAKGDLIDIPSQEFLLALCEKDITGMRAALDKYFDKKLFKKSVYGADMFFDFYLQMQVLMYAKIAAIHGFDLGIDSVYAPKELIEYKPLEKYEDPYDFMKEFDYNQPQQVWIDKYNEKMRLAKEAEEQKKKKGIFSRLFKW